MTERLDHLENLTIHLKEILDDVVVFRGGMKASERRAAHETLRETGPRPRIVLSTGRYLGEGFDDSRFDALFLTMPIAWKGTLAQYVGRLHREHEGKRDVLVYDSVDGLVPMLARMSAKRQRGYRGLGFVLKS